MSTTTTITFQRKKLLDALVRCLPLANSKTTLPITSCIVFQMGRQIVGPNEVPNDIPCISWQVRATNMETFLTIDLKPYVASGPDKEEKLLSPIAIPCDKLKNLVASMSECEAISVTITIPELEGSSKEGTGESSDAVRTGTVVISSADIKGKYRLPFFPGDQFPTEKKNEGEEPSQLKWNNSNGLLKRVIARNTGNPSKAAANASDMSDVILFFPLDGHLVAANTDGYAGVYETVTIDTEGAEKVSAGACEPFELFLEAAKSLNEFNGDAQIHVSSTVVRVNGDGFEASFLRPESSNVQYLQGTFKNISKLSKAFVSRIAINKTDLLHAVRRTVICGQIGAGAGHSSTPSVLLNFGSESLRVSGPATDQGESYEDITDIYTINIDEGAEAKILVNPVLLKRVIAELGDVLEISYNHEQAQPDDKTGGKLLQLIAISDQDNENFNGFLSGMVWTD